MNWGSLIESFEQIWQHKPKLLLFLLFGFLIFVGLVVDAWILRRRKKRHRKI